MTRLGLCIIFAPNETASNRLDALFEVTDWTGKRNGKLLSSDRFGELREDR